jgi:uncharacterized protein (UPF0264 family)
VSVPIQAAPKGAAMPELIARTEADVEAIRSKGDHTDSRRAAWFAIGRGSDVIADIQREGSRHSDWFKLEDALPCVNPPARRILEMRLEAIHRFKQAPHHAKGLRPSARTGQANPRPVNALCLISGYEGQEIPGLVGYDRVVVDAEHMEQALGPATLTEIFKIRKHIGEHVYISTNVSETPQLVRNLQTGEVDTRATAALTASKVIAAVGAGADVVKVGFANLDPTKRDLRSENVSAQMALARDDVNGVVEERLIVMPLNVAGRIPLVSVFFPEIGIDSHGERPREIAEKGIALTAKGGWQGILIDTFEKYTGKHYREFYSLKDTADLARAAHAAGIEFWIAGSIGREEVEDLLACGVDLICFGGAARHESAERIAVKDGVRDESIKRPLVEDLVRRFEEADPRPKS